MAPQQIIFVLFKVTRLGEFSPFGRLFTLGRFVKITDVAHIFGLHFSAVVLIGLILARMSLATLWAILSQTLLVALVLFVFHMLMMLYSIVFQLSGNVVHRAVKQFCCCQAG
jgi:hypothetical protein